MDKALDKAIKLLEDAEFTKRNLNIHHAKHKHEFNNISREDYAAKAKNNSENSKIKGDIEYRRKDGSKVRYNLRNGELTIWNVKENEVITLFKPKFDPVKKIVKATASKEYVRNDMKKNGKIPPF